MKNLFLKTLMCFCGLLCSYILTSCHNVQPDADEETVFIYKPWIFGHGGIDYEPATTGLTWCWASTMTETFKIVPQRYDIEFDDIMSNDNTPLDYATYITLQIIPGKSPILLENYGIDWFSNNIEAVYRNFVREEISKYSPFDLMSNREVCNQIDSDVKAKLDNHIAALSANREFPIICREVITGRAKPNTKQLEEMNNTAAQIQAKQTQERRYETELAREAAERQRAISDKAYQREMGLSADQFISLKAWDVIAAKKGANIDVLFNADNTQSMWNVRRN